MIMIIIIGIIKIIIETIYIFIGDRKQIRFFVTHQKKITYKRKLARNLPARYHTGLLANCSGSKPFN